MSSDRCISSILDIHGPLLIYRPPEGWMAELALIEVEWESNGGRRITVGSYEGRSISFEPDLLK